MTPEESPFHSDPVLLNALAELASSFPCPEDSVLFEQDEECSGVFILHRGHATLEMKTHAGQVAARFTADDGSVLGLPAMLSGERYSLTAVALGGSEVGFVAASDFLGLMNSRPDLSLKALHILAAETRAARAALLDVFDRRASLKRRRNIEPDFSI